MEGAKLNILRINEKISDINEAMATLTDYARQDEQAFLNNPEAIRSARYCFIILTEAATNIATHVCARVLKKRTCRLCSKALTLLSEHKIIDSSLAVSLGRMIGFRNLLVHGYNKIDNKKMLQIMRHNLNDVKSYLKAVEELIKKHRGEYQNDKKN